MLQLAILLHVSLHPGVSLKELRAAIPTNSRKRHPRAKNEVDTPSRQLFSRQVAQLLDGDEAEDGGYGLITLENAKSGDRRQRHARLTKEGEKFLATLRKSSSLTGGRRRRQTPREV